MCPGCLLREKKPGEVSLRLVLRLESLKELGLISCGGGETGKLVKIVDFFREFVRRPQTTAHVCVRCGGTPSTCCEELVVRERGRVERNIGRDSCS